MGSTASNMVVPRTRRWAAVWATILTLTLLGVDHGAGGASSVPTPGEIIHRVLMARAAARVASADVQLRLYVHKPVLPPPDCTFAGTLRVEQGRPIIRLGERSPAAICAIVERRGLGPLFKSLEPLETFFARFELSVLDQELVDNNQYYRIQGTAHDPNGDPHGFIAWSTTTVESFPKAPSTMRGAIWRRGRPMIALTMRWCW